MTPDIITHIKAVFKTWDQVQQYADKTQYPELEGECLAVRELPQAPKEHTLILPDSLDTDTEDTHKWVLCLGSMTLIHDVVRLALVPNYSGVSIPGRKGIKLVSDMERAMHFYLTQKLFES